ncbi:DNA-binding response regulator [Enterocloster aldenensis]|uniref:response regulator transcription factor n=1 Tax=Enterocloster aldenensis TaxID=358742 RepID=UPI000E48D5E4|nr:DNA-binding response regulator [Enterocloster aldenensis]
MDKILVVDDDLHLRKLVYTYADLSGYVCDEASNGEEALTKIQNETYSLIVLDIMMPGMDGFEVLAKIRETSQVPVIMLTARNEEYDKLLGFNLGVDDYLSKPFSPKELMARIGAVLKRTNGKTNRKFTFDGLSVDVEAREVLVNHAKVSLPPKEFDLLLKLIQNEHKVMSREKLLETVWGYDYLGDTRTVDTHIKDLREHLGEYRRYIQTAWGVGYKFEHNEN